MSHDALIDALSGYVDTWSDGTVVYRNAARQPHRLDGPAVIYPSGTRAWYQNGRLHRTDGPAVVRADGSSDWFLRGSFMSYKDFQRRAALEDCHDT